MLPTSSPSPDYYGGERTAEMPYTTAVVTLNARTGERVWHFQTMRHNLWDYDLASQPALVTIRRDGVARDAVAQATKMGFVFVLDRETGAPLFPVVERPGARSTVPGEVTAPTQPVPQLPTPIAQADDQARGRVRASCISTPRRASASSRRSTTRASTRRRACAAASCFPLFGGGSNWGSVAYDPASNLLVANTMNLVGMAQVIPRADFAAVAKANPGDQATAQRGTPFGMRRKILMSFLGVPCNPPPWGELSAIDLATGEIRWRVPLGQVKKGPFYTFESWGSPNIGGPVVTAGGLVFIAATMDKKIRAFDLANGAKVWEARLPAFGMATPMTYESGGTPVRRDRRGRPRGARRMGRLGDRVRLALMAFPIEVSEEEGVRYLHFGSSWIQGAMRIARPDALELDYTRDMMFPLLLREGGWPRTRAARSASAPRR